MKEIVIKICRIDCAACVDRLNRTLGETEGVLEAAVNYAAGSAYLRYDEEKLGIPDIARCIRKAGYEVPLGRAELYCEGLDPERSDEYIAAVSAIDEVQSASFCDGNATMELLLWPVGADIGKPIAALRELGVWAKPGESLPVEKNEGDELVGGTLNRSGTVRLSALRLGKESVLSQIIDTVRRAQSSKAPVQRLADKIASVFVPIVLVLSAAVFCVWYFVAAPGDLDRALYCVCSLTVIACPCALGLATPTALMVGAGRAAELGVLYRDGAELELAHKVSTVVFDKTGTLTEGKPEVCGMHTCPDADAETALIFAAALERLSLHPLSAAVTSYAAYRFPNALPPAVEGFEEVAGMGLSGTVSGERVVCGSRKLLLSFGVDTSVLPEPEGTAAELCIAVGERALAAVYVADRLRAKSAETVARLKRSGIEVWMLTGDNDKTAKAIASECGIDRVISSVLPEEKAAKIAELKSGGRVVAMVGDGINDAPALAQADLAIAMGSGSDIAADSAGVVLLGGRIEATVTALRLSKNTMRTVRQNLLWAVLYNVICIPAAAFGIVNPSMAAAAMTLSSNGVLLNSLRLQKAGEKKNERRNGAD